MGRDALLWAAVFFSIAGSSFAHDGGHGPLIAGKGPNGGRLAAVVAAAEADLGPKAKPIGLVEWKREGNRVEIRLLDLQRKPLAPKAGGDLKWILLGGEKPEVVAEPFAAAELKHEFPSLQKVKKVEVILPAGALVEGKAVAAFSIVDKTK
jgi:hypothetical protein